ncbi:MAG: methyltransferase domain-containing protein [Qipengyuania sp.]|jgi:hypothetical protein
MHYSPINRFRGRRGRLLRQQIETLADHLDRDIAVVDVGGRADYWANVGVERIARITLINASSSELSRDDAGLPSPIFERRLGDARDLTDYGDKAVDLIHSNSVIEHVGGWRDMAAMASEMLRVGRAGWMQTPAWEFPIEPHFRAPFLHWVAAPARARMLSLSTEKRLRQLDLHRRRQRVEGINLLSKREVEALFPDCDIFVERLVLAKSYSARWMPDNLPL